MQAILGDHRLKTKEELTRLMGELRETILSIMNIIDTVKIACLNFPSNLNAIFLRTYIGFLCIGLKRSKLIEESNAIFDVLIGTDCLL